ncbi:MAG TPA: LPS assembly protein LptD [Caulobacteraceae bacterium]|jgi:LPS-assembly protein
MADARPSPLPHRFAPCLRALLLAGAATLALAAPAFGQTLGERLAMPPAAVDDGLGENGFYLEADSLTSDQEADTVTAEGQVEARYRGRVLRAETVTYGLESGVGNAKGEVQILNPDGTAEFADAVVLDKDLNAGAATNFAARLQNNVKIAAASAIRRSPTLNELNRAIYTPCDTCNANGEPKQPTYSISAEKVVQDTERRTIYYRNAVVRLKGVPILYAPVFWHADPTAGAQSGLLAPEVSITERRGLSVELPYYWRISPSADLVVSPMVNSKVNPFLNLHFRELFASGAIDARAGFTHEAEFDNSGIPVPGSDTTSRSYILASAVFRPIPNWTFGVAAERVSDPLLFDRYDIADVYQQRGLYATDTRRLLSQAWAVRQDQSSYVSVAALTFQGLQIGDVQSAMPIAAPVVEARWAPTQPVLGGRLTLEGNAVVLTREESLEVPGTEGADSRRATAEAEWRRAFIAPAGVRIEPFGMARFDLYSNSDIPGGLATETSTRTLATAGVDVTWPLARMDGGLTTIVEPIAQAAISPEPDPNPGIPNLDSADLPFDETNLFDPNRAPGFDVYDAGARLNLGVRTSFYWGEGRQARVLVGKSFRKESNPLLPPSSGYRGRESDWIVAASAAPLRGLSLYGRTRLSPEELEVRRFEAGASYVLPRVTGFARYLDDRTDPLAGRTENVEAAADVFVTPNWGVILYGRRDLQTDEWTRNDLGVVYQDECARFELVYYREQGSRRLGGDAEGVRVRLTLATLGDPGYRQDGGW